ncbi:MAG: VOC family protein [Acidimicrobiia bacterium]|nr:VOC family protein [Acidimicrobiia bacterium]MBT8250102.1 VOC family protein [Acidimicrobiia bacterium]NND13356.1 hypothetical protein [Acidimicrobiia bacterium]NNL28268.1 hypothetical protein [Acidimicrobiia bacterium]
MEIKRISWLGSSTDDRAAMTAFFRDQLGMTLTVDVKGFSRLTTSNGDRIEFFGPDSVEHDQLDTGPVAGFLVDDVAASRQELIDAGVTSCTEIEHSNDGHRWFYFRAPDGNFYELCETHEPRPVKSSRP